MLLGVASQTPIFFERAISSCFSTQLTTMFCFLLIFFPRSSLSSPPPENRGTLPSPEWATNIFVCWGPKCQPSFEHFLRGLAADSSGGADAECQRLPEVPVRGRWSPAKNRSVGSRRCSSFSALSPPKDGYPEKKITHTSIC